MLKDAMFLAQDTELYNGNTSETPVSVHPFHTSSALSYRNYQYVIMMSQRDLSQHRMVQGPTVHRHINVCINFAGIHLYGEREDGSER